MRPPNSVGVAFHHLAMSAFGTAGVRLRFFRAVATEPEQRLPPLARRGGPPVRVDGSVRPGLLGGALRRSKQRQHPAVVGGAACLELYNSQCRHTI